MVMGTLANLYVILQTQTIPTVKTVVNDAIEVKDIISADLIANEIAKQQINEKSMYT